MWALDIDPDVPRRFAVSSNVDLRIGAADGLLLNMLDELDAAGIVLNFVLIDADHSSAGVRRDIENIIHRALPPREPMVTLMHDSGNPGCRQGISGASGWAARVSSRIQHVELDFVPV